MYQWDWQIIVTYKQVFLHGALVTLELSLLVIAMGTVFGFALAFAKRSKETVLVWLANSFIEIFRILPILVVLIWIYYVLPVLFNWRVSAFTAAVLALGFHLSAFVAETARAGIESVPEGQFESAASLGLNSRQTMTEIILPQALRNMTPNLLGLYLNEVKNSSLASVIAVNELLHQGNLLISNTFRPLEIYTTVAIVYALILVPLTLLARWAEKKYSVGVVLKA
jgi:polar amino acid transport system permease protein